MKHFDTGSIIIIVVTFILFVAALFFTGFTHDLLLETGVFLVSVKLIIMAYKASVLSEDIHRELEEIKELLKNDKENRELGVKSETSAENANASSESQKPQKLQANVLFLLTFLFPRCFKLRSH